MSTIRKVKKLMRSKPTLEGAGVRLKRAFGFYHVPQLDPFLLLDDFHSNNPKDYIKGFPWHPHRGIETITYVLYGKIEHGDSMQNKGVIGAGDVQWMTAGSGIIHQEMPKGQKDGLMWGFQLWANLPASHKMMDPRYREVKGKQIPDVSTDSDTKVKIICGEVDGVNGPVRGIVTDPEYLDVSVPPNGSFSREIKRGHTAFAYVIDGNAYFDDKRDPYAFEVEAANYFDIKRNALVGSESLVMFDDGDRVTITASPKGVRFLLLSGKPIREPVAWYGPIVMNTQEELRVAFDEYERGTFIKHKR
jgi:redox-sensitive bicupin YhaK (pirin superfamily)